MKRIAALFLAVLSVCLAASAQKRSYLLPEFSMGEILFQGQSRPETVKMNIDIAGQRIFFYQDATLMELTNMNLIRTLKVDGRLFLMKDGLLCEAVHTENARIVYINWHIKNVNRGTKGALGAVTQNKVDVLWTGLNAGDEAPGEGRFAQKGDYLLEIWEMKADNTYIFLLDDTQYRVKRLKDLYKAFPALAPQLKSFAKENKAGMECAQEALRMIDRLYALQDRGNSK